MGVKKTIEYWNLYLKMIISILFQNKHISIEHLLILMME